jgi:hypothetical protein
MPASITLLVAMLTIVAIGVLASGARSHTTAWTHTTDAPALRTPALDPVEADLRELLRRLPALQAAATTFDTDAQPARGLTVRAPLASEATEFGVVPIIGGAHDGAVLVRIPVRRADRLVAVAEARLVLTALARLFDTGTPSADTLVMLDAGRAPLFAIPAAAHRAQARIAEWLYRTDVAALPQRPIPAAPTLAIAAAQPDTPTPLELALLMLAAWLACLLIERLRALQRLLDACSERYRLVVR